MKIKQKYTKITPVEAARLLADKGTPIENCIFSNYEDVGYRSHIRSRLTGIDLAVADFTFLSGQCAWKKCWKVEKETVFEVGDWVRACNHVTGVHGLCGIVTAIYPDGYPIHFGAHTLLLKADELELAPEPDPFEAVLEAFNAGRDYERKLHE